MNQRKPGPLRCSRKDYREDVKNGCFFDDVIGIQFLSERAVAQCFLRDVMDDDTIELNQDPLCHKEHLLTAGRSIITDIELDDTQGNHYNIEIQRDPRGMSFDRMRYYQGMQDIDALKPGDLFSRLPRHIAIVIAASDLTGHQKPIVHYRWCSIEDGHEAKEMRCDLICINGRYRGDDRLGALLHDLWQTEPKKMNNPVYVARMARVKASSEEVMKMLAYYEDFYDKYGGKIFHQGEIIREKRGLERGEKLGLKRDE